MSYLAHCTQRVFFIAGLSTEEYNIQQKFHPLHGKQACNKKDFLSVPTF